jgi:hypothetical protein
MGGKSCERLFGFVDPAFDVSDLGGAYWKK